LCENFVSQSIDAQNVCSLLEVSQVYESNTLFANCLEFAIKHYEQIKTLPDYTEMPEALRKQIESKVAPPKQKEGKLWLVAKHD
jgi:hypothetical protein